MIEIKTISQRYGGSTYGNEKIAEKEIVNYFFNDCFQISFALGNGKQLSRVNIENRHSVINA